MAELYSKTALREKGGRKGGREDEGNRKREGVREGRRRERRRWGGRERERKEWREKEREENEGMEGGRGGRGVGREEARKGRVNHNTPIKLVQSVIRPVHIPDIQLFEGLGLRLETGTAWRLLCLSYLIQHLQTILEK